MTTNSRSGDGDTPTAAIAPLTIPAGPLRSLPLWGRSPRSTSLQLLALIGLALTAQALHWPLLLLASGLALLALSLLVLLPPLLRDLQKQLDDPTVLRVIAIGALLLGCFCVLLQLGWLDPYLSLWHQRDWEAIGAIGEGVVGAFGQILVALVALLIAWQQVRVDQRLTGQQNVITQAQTIDSLIQGISELIVDEEGLLEDWPLERMLAEGRLAAVLSSIDAQGKARVLRFLSHALLLSPLRRDARLGRAILDGQGSYEVDWQDGVAVVQLHSMLRGSDLSRCDLRGVDLHGADLRGVDFSGADLSEANLAGADLSGATLDRCCLDGTRLFFGRPQTASPSHPGRPRDLLTGAGSGAVVVDASFRGVRRLDPQQHYYLASWSGARARGTLPGGCRGIANQLDSPNPER
jgi:uncharacterized protein YjbI with pentapeptide repeats